MKTAEGSALEVEQTPVERRLSTIFLAPFNDGSTDPEVARRLSISLGTEFVDLTQDAKAATASVTDVDSLKAALGNIGKNDCGACHQDYRLKKG